MLDPTDGLRPRLGLGLGEHGLREVHRGDVCSARRQLQGVAARAAADVGDAEPPNIAQQACDLRLFEGDQRVVLVIVDRRPAIVTLAGGEDVDRRSTRSLWLRHGA